MGGGDFCLPVESPLPTSSGLLLGEWFPLALLLRDLCSDVQPWLEKFFFCQLGDILGLNPPVIPPASLEKETCP